MWTERLLYACSAVSTHTQAHIQVTQLNPKPRGSLLVDSRDFNEELRPTLGMGSHCLSPKSPFSLLWLCDLLVS